MLVGTISKGIKYKGKPFSEFAARKIGDYISNEFVATAIKLEVNALGEGWENVLVWGIGKFGQWLTYQDDKTLRELLTSEEAMSEAAEAFWSGLILEGLPRGLDSAYGQKDILSQINNSDFALRLPAPTGKNSPK